MGIYRILGSSTMEAAPGAGGSKVNKLGFAEICAALSTLSWECGVRHFERIGRRKCEAKG